MGHRRFTAQWLKLLAVTGLVGSVLVGCGEDGDPGPAGSSGAVIAPITGASELGITITGVKISSPPVVTFRLTNQNGEQVTGLTANDVRFTIAKLVPGTYGNPSTWQSYINTTASGAAGTRTQATREGGSTGSFVGTFVANGDGTYTYTFKTDITKVTSPLAVPYDPNLTHRVAVQTRGSLPLAVGTYTFRPSDGATGVVTREVVNTDKCNQCHGTLQAHDQRIDTKYCVTCHNPGSSDPDTGNTVDFKVMIHKIHMGEHLPSVQAGTPYRIIGFGGTVHDYSEVVLPQDVRNCTKCHDGADPATPQGNNWQLQPSVEACGACHDNVNFATGAGHAGGIKDNSTCLACHSTGGEVGPVASSHVTENSTANNPNVPAGAVHFTYQIASVTTSDPALPDTHKQPVVKFRILGGASASVTGTPIAFTCNASSSTTANTLLAGFSGSPSFVVAYALAQDGVVPADYNNRGKSAAQPSTVSIANICNGTQGSMAGPDADGYYTATITGSTRGFPAGSTLRAVGLQGYFTQLSPAVARHAISVVKGVTGDPQRRAIIDPTKCGNCHEWLELHGGNRVVAAGSDPTQPVVCLMCHNPNLTSSGRSASPATILERLAIGDAANGDPAGTQAAQLNADGYVASDPTTYPEATNNFKNLVHGIHGSAKRTTPYRFVRDRGTSGVYYYDWSHVGFPGILKNCETCHKTPTQGGGYDLEILPAGALASIDITTSRSTVPNEVVPNVDLVSTPIAATCVMCHDTAPVKAHMTSNGGFIATDRVAVNNAVASGAGEKCLTCHGPGRVAAVAEMHAK